MDDGEAFIEEEGSHRRCPSPREPHRSKAFKRAAKERSSESPSAGDAPRTPLSVNLCKSPPASSKGEAQIHPPRSHNPNSHHPTALHRCLEHTSPKHQEADSYLRVSKDRKKPHNGEVPSSIGPRPHWPLADAGENAAETMKEPEGLIPPTSRRRHRLAGAAREPKPR